MFQYFDVISDSSKSEKRISALRELLKKEGLNGYLVPLSDEHQGEYIAPYAKRLAWLTGFTGSAGVALILLDKAIMFTDGRYTIQVRQQTNNKIFEYIDMTVMSISQYLADNLNDAKIALDPSLFTIAQATAIKNSLKNNNSELVYPSFNLIDAIWNDQPAHPKEPIYIHGIEYSGQESKDKIENIKNFLKNADANYTVLNDTCSIAWLFNIRGSDVEHTPVALSFACINVNDGATIFIDKDKLNPKTTEYLSSVGTIKNIDEFENYIENEAKKQLTFSLDPNNCNEKIYHTIISNGGKVKFISDPIKLSKAIKNPTELEGARQAHIYDGVALVRFLSWLSKQPYNKITEIDAAKTLEQYRATTAKEFNVELKDISFDSISGAGEHGAIVHYRVTTDTNRAIKEGDLYLIDSGAQYLSGTTDVTRTIAIGNAKTEEKKCFTLVLKGMITLSMAKFLPNTKGLHLDILARFPLLQYGLNYAHGTGHGVGSYLSVHEGPQSITHLSEQILYSNMILSNEPGYYKSGHFGIRIENLIIVNPASKSNSEEVATHSFETLTLCPIDINLIDKTMLNNDEIQWLNDYHQTVYNKLHNYLNEEDKEWLKNATKNL